MPLTIQADPDALAGILEELKSFKGEANRELAAAVNRTGRQGRKLIVQSFFKGTTLPQKAILSRVSGPRPQARPEKLETRLVIKGKPAAVSSFQFTFDRESGVGVLVSFLRGVITEIPNGFVGIGPRGKPHVMQRAIGKRRQLQAHYLPNLGKNRQLVTTVPGKSLIDLLQVAPQLLEAPAQQIHEVLARECAAAMDKVLSKPNRPVGGRTLKNIQKEFA
jgi:hypothetical protein